MDKIAMNVKVMAKHLGVSAYTAYPIDEATRVSDTEDWKANRHSRRAVYGLDSEARRQ